MGRIKTQLLRPVKYSKHPSPCQRKRPRPVNCARKSRRHSCFHTSAAESNVHPTAFVHPGVKIPRSSTVGAYSIIDSGNVVVGENCKIKSHVVVGGNTNIGNNCTIFPFSVIGEVPQDKKYSIGDVTFLNIGNNTTIREHVTISPGTLQGGGITKIGSNCLLMASVHIGHDTIVGNNVTIANSTCLAGHVVVEDYATIGGLCGIRQRIHIGKLSMVGGGTVVDSNVLPYGLMFGNRGKLHGVNLVGLKRFGYNNMQIKLLLRAFRYLFPNTPAGMKSSGFARPLDLPEEVELACRVNNVKGYIEVHSEETELIDGLLCACIDMNST